jgi:hypothetical protein
VVGDGVPARIPARARVVLQPSVDPVRVAVFKLVEQAMTEVDHLAEGRPRRQVAQEP